MNKADDLAAKPPLFFDEFFEMGLHETVSPFITPETRQWGADLTVKASALAACLLGISFVLSWFASTIFISYLLLIAVYCLAGIPSLIESVQDLLNFEINIDILMTMAAFSSVLIGSGMEGGLLLVLFSLSGAMEDAVTERAKGAISNLHKMSPTKATVVEDSGMLIERSVGDIPVGTTILVKAGQMVPLDGIVIKGVSSVTLAHLTGENLPLIKKEGDDVPAGANNLEGALTLNVTHTSADSTLSRIIKLVTQAQEARPKLQRWFDAWSNRYALTIILLSAFFAISFPLFLGIPFLGIEGSLYRALAFLIAASPCALIIAIPIAYLSALSICAKQGILLKGGVALDALASCRVLAFDKTGTLTSGKLSLIGIESVQIENSQEGDKKEALAVAYALEKNAVHPIAHAIITEAEAQQSPHFVLEEFRSIPGYGLEARWEGRSVYIGNPDYIYSKLLQKGSEELHTKIEGYKNLGELLALLLIGQNLYLFRFRDTLRPHIKETIAELKKRSEWRLVMLTGDHQQSAKAIADEVGIEEFHADLKPEEKLQYVSQAANAEGLAMIGDGINDAPALARATVGIGMGKVGNTAAVEAADIVLLHDNIELVNWLITIADKTQSIVKQNLLLAISALIIASLPALAGFIPLWLAVVMHEGGTVLVGLNALRILSCSPKKT